MATKVIKCFKIFLFKKDLQTLLIIDVFYDNNALDMSGF